MRSRAQCHHLEGVCGREFGKIEAVEQLGKGARRARNKTGQVEGQALAQQFQPVLLSGPQGLGMGRAFGDGIVTDADRRPPGDEGAERKPIGPFAGGKQQVQLSILSALRLGNRRAPLET
jgi:hypothetical protein